MTARNYSNLAVNATVPLGVPASTAGTSMTFVVDNAAGYPAPPFVGALDRGTNSEEIVLVTVVTGTSITALRGYDNTSPMAHSPGVIFEHVTAAIDYSEANTHVNSTVGAHTDINGLYTSTSLAVTSTHQVTGLTDTTAPVKIGPDAGNRLAVDGDSIQSALGTAPASLYLNPSGGKVYAGATTDDARLVPHALLRAVSRSEAMLMGGGILTTSSSNELKWTQRFITISSGGGSWWSSNSFFDMIMPAAGTVIPGYAGASNYTVTSGGILISPWVSLYYEPVVGGINTSLDANYRLVSYLSAFLVPEHWIKIATRNGDSNMTLVANRHWLGPSGRLNTTWGSGVDFIAAPGFSGAWVNYGGGFNPAGYLLDSSGFVHLRGLIRNGALNSGVFTLPAGYRPEFNCMHACIASPNVGIRVDVQSAGLVFVSGAAAGTSASNAYVSLDGISFKQFQ